MGYLEFYKLKDDPFRLTPDPEYFFPSEGHELGIKSLDYAVENKEGFCVITGEPGTGKTTLLNVFIKEWEKRADIAVVLTPRLMPEEFLAAVLEDLGIDIVARNKNELIKQFRDYLLKRHNHGRSVIIIVDEAQNLPVETIEELRLLSNLETDREKLLQIVLVGQPELDTILKSQPLRQLNQRIVTRLSLKLLNKMETEEYINFRLFRAGKTILRFDGSAINRIYRYTKGNPRLINIVAKRSLMAAYLEESMVISREHVKKAERSLKDEGEYEKSTTISYKRLIPVFFILLLGLGVYFLTINFNNKIPPQPEKDVPLSKAAEKVNNINSALLIEDKEKINESRSTPAQKIGVSKKMHALVSVNQANVRIKPGLEYVPISIVRKGEKFIIEDTSVDNAGRRWYLINLSEQRKGWISEHVVVTSD